MKSVIADILLAGDRVSTDMFNARVSVTGGFAAAEDEDAAEKNSVRVAMSPAASLKREVAVRARV